jgi:methylthioribulose-1-phosphate dehydratase
VTRAEAGEILAAEAKRFHARGWMMGTAGNLSVRVSRDPLRFYITASGKDKGELAPDDIALAGENGEAISEPGAGNKPSAEAGLHARIYKRTGCGAIFHVHTVSAVTVGAPHAKSGGLVTASGLEMLKGIGREAENDEVQIPVIPNSQDMAVLAERFEKSHVEKTPGLIVASHGLYAWGPDPTRTRHHVEIFEWLFQYLAHNLKP